MDALLTQQPIARQILAQGGHYLMIVKANQPSLSAAIALLFRTPPVPARPGELLDAQTGGKGHGRLERRLLSSSTALTGYLDWPGAAQVMRRTCRRLNLRSGLLETKTTYGITSLPRELAEPKQLEQFWRGHWTIENCLHYVRDETLGEDRCQVHSGHAPQALAAFRKPSCRYYASTDGAISQPPPAATPKNRSVFCDSSAFPHNESALRFLSGQSRLIFGSCAHSRSKSVQ